MIADRHLLEAAIAAGEELGLRREEDPIRWTRWLPLQLAFLTDPSRLKQIRAGNQTIGKSWVALSEVIGRCRGEHPAGLPTKAPPVTWWVVCASWKQSMAVQEKLVALLPWSELDPRTSFDEINGFSPTKSPVILFANGSRIRIKTTGQDALDFSSDTIDGVLFDEPPRHQRLLTEAIKRVERKGGHVLLSYTPINAPTDYLRVMCEAGQISDHWARLTPEQLIPVGSRHPLRTEDGRSMDAAWIAHLEQSTPAVDREITVHGEWESRAAGRYFSCWVDAEGQGLRSGFHHGDVDLLLGVDHGSKPGKQIAVLIANWQEMVGDEMRERVHVIDETPELDASTPLMDAREVLDMLARNGQTWGDLAFAGGDRIHRSGSAGQKSNRELEQAIADLLHIDVEALSPRIADIKRGEGRGAASVRVRARWLFHRAVEGGFWIHPRCHRVRKTWRETDLSDDDLKDPFDGVAYACDDLTFPRPTVRVVRNG